MLICEQEEYEQPTMIPLLYHKLEFSVIISYNFLLRFIDQRQTLYESDYMIQFPYRRYVIRHSLCIELKQTNIQVFFYGVVIAPQCTATF